MEWREIAKRIDEFRYEFDKSYKCINKDAVIKSRNVEKPYRDSSKGIQ